MSLLSWTIFDFSAVMAVYAIWQSMQTLHFVSVKVAMPYCWRYCWYNTLIICEVFQRSILTSECLQINITLQLFTSCCALPTHKHTHYWKKCQYDLQTCWSIRLIGRWSTCVCFSFSGRQHRNVFDQFCRCDLNIIIIIIIWFLRLKLSPPSFSPSGCVVVPF